MIGQSIESISARGHDPKTSAEFTRSVLGALLVISVIVFAACLQEPTVKLTFANESDSRLCYYPSPADAASDDFCAEVKARGKTVWRPECGAAGKQPMTVVLTLSQGGREVYNQTATCDEWRDSGGRILIEQHGNELVVTDNLSASQN